MITPQLRHAHKGTGFDWEKISLKDIKDSDLANLKSRSYNDLTDKPTIPTWTQFYTWSDSHWSTGNKVITWVWFAPKYINLIATFASWDRSVISWWMAQWSETWRTIYQHQNTWWEKVSWTSFNTSRIINLEWNDWSNNDIYATISDWWSDGFTLNFTTADATCNFIYTCIG